MPNALEIPDDSVREGEDNLNINLSIYSNLDASEQDNAN
jgi:hypothetical protein